MRATRLVCYIAVMALAAAGMVVADHSGTGVSIERSGGALDSSLAWAELVDELELTDASEFDGDMYDESMLLELESELDSEVSSSTAAADDHCRC